MRQEAPIFIELCDAVVGPDAIRDVAALLADEEGAFSRAMAAKEMKARHYAAYSAAHLREAGGRARKKG